MTVVEWGKACLSEATFIATIFWLWEQPPAEVWHWVMAWVGAMMALRAIVGKLGHEK